MSLRFLTPLRKLAAAGWSPLDESSLALYVDGNYTAGMNGGTIVDGTGIQTYVDPSPNALTFSQATVGKRPVYKANILDGRGVMRFSEASFQHLLNSSLQLITSGTAFTLVTVSKLGTFASGNMTDKALLGLYGASGDESPTLWWDNTGGWAPGIGFLAKTSFTATPTTSSPPSLSTWYSYKLTHNGGTASTLANYGAEINRAAETLHSGMAQSWSNNQENIIGGWKSDDVTGYYWDGDIALIMLFSSAGPTLQTNINTWLSAQFPSV